MADMCISIQACAFGANGQVVVQHTTVATDGAQGAGDVLVDFSTSVVQFNNNLEEAVKAYMFETFGTVVGPGDRVIIVGGRVK